MSLCANTFAMARILLLALASVILCTWGQELPLAAECDPLACQLPDCRCSTTDIPGGLEPRDTPQFVAFTFDDAINVINIEFYRRIFDNRINKNGCPAQLTFFFKHEYTNYQLVNELYNKGHEIGLNSITHQTPQTYWTEATYDDMLNEIGYQRFQMAHFANIPFEEIKGVRIPFMQTGGNASFQMMKDVGLTYDSTWGSSQSNRGLWPYTLDYASTQDCNIPPCPTASIPGVWVHPLISWIDRSGFPCIILQACYDAPLPTDEEGWFRFMVENFERHYFGNRSPFVFNSHEWYFVAFPAVERALVRFLNMINSLEDVFMVQQSKIIDWVKNPVPINEYTSAAGVCPQVQPRICFANNCGPLFAEHNLMDYWVGTCTNCPRVFPWLGNPLGI